jgi:hydroxymethylbilane synthase
VKQIADLDIGAVVGTSSLRRRAQLINRRPDLKVVEFRGNVQTRLRKLDDGVALATFLAAAGLNRLGLADIGAPIETDDILPAIAQGCIGIEQRAGDEDSATALAMINDASSQVRLSAERSLLRGLDGSCQTPIAGLATLYGDQMMLKGEVLRPDGSECFAETLKGPISDAVEMGQAMADSLRLKMGDNFFA